MPTPSTRDRVWRCAQWPAPRQPLSLTPPRWAKPTVGVSITLDRSWGQRHEVHSILQTHPPFCGGLRTISLKKLYLVHSTYALIYSSVGEATDGYSEEVQLKWFKIIWIAYSPRSSEEVSSPLPKRELGLEKSSTLTERQLDHCHFAPTIQLLTYTVHP